MPYSVAHAWSIAGSAAPQLTQLTPKKASAFYEQPAHDTICRSQAIVAPYYRLTRCRTNKLFHLAQAAVAVP